MNLQRQLLVLTNRKQGNRKQQTLPPVCTLLPRQTAWHHLENTLEIYNYLLQHCSNVDTANSTCHRAHFGKTWHHPQNHKYITYSAVVNRTEPRPWKTMYRKFGKIWTCGFWDMWADRQTGTLIAILCTPPRGKVITQLQNEHHNKI